MQLDHPFIIKLFATFKDRDHLYFLQEVCLGGELFRVLRHRNYFDEQTSRVSSHKHSIHAGLVAFARQ